MVNLNLNRETFDFMASCRNTLELRSISPAVLARLCTAFLGEGNISFRQGWDSKEVWVCSSTGPAASPLLCPANP